MFYYGHYSVAMAKSQPFSIRLGEDAELLVPDEVRRSGRSRSAVVEELAEEAARRACSPVSRSAARHGAMVIGTGLDVWEILELLRSYDDDEQRLRAAHPTVDERHLRLAPRVRQRFPDEIVVFRDEIDRSLDELRRLYPFLQTSV